MSDIADATYPVVSTPGQPIIKFAYLSHNIYLLVPNENGDGFDPNPLNRPVEKLFAKTIRRGVSQEDGALCVSLIRDVPVRERHTEDRRAQLTAEIVAPLAQHLSFGFEEIPWGDFLDLLHSNKPTPINHP